jgi:hypothetical protein
MKFGIWWVQNGKHQKAPGTAAKKNLCCWTKGGFTLPTSVPTSDASEGLVGFHHLEDLELQRGPVQWHCWDPDVHIWYYTYVCCVCKMWRCIYTYVQLYLKYICIINVCVGIMYLHTIPLFYTYVCFSYIMYYIYAWVGCVLQWSLCLSLATKKRLFWYIFWVCLKIKY